MTHTTNPADVELVTAADVRLGDVLVSFTPIGGHVVTPPTARQLALRRTRWTTVATITTATTPHGVRVIDFNGGACAADGDGSTFLPTAHVWRVKR